MAGDETDSYNVDCNAGDEGDKAQKLAPQYISSIDGLDNLTGIYLYPSSPERYKHIPG